MDGSATPGQVLADHLEWSRSGSEEDFLRSYREDSFLIMPSGVRRGLESIRACYRQLNKDLPNARYTYKVRLVALDHDASRQFALNVEIPLLDDRIPRINKEPFADGQNELRGWPAQWSRRGAKRQIKSIRKRIVEEPDGRTVIERNDKRRKAVATRPLQTASQGTDGPAQEVPVRIGTATISDEE